MVDQAAMEEAAGGATVEDGAVTGVAASVVAMEAAAVVRTPDI